MTNLIDRIEGAEAGSRALDRAIWNALEFASDGEPTRCPAYTTCVTAALALAERVLPDETFWEIGHQSIISGDKMFWAAVYPPCATVERPMQDALSRTPALALCAAILRAKAHDVKKD